MEPAVVPLDRIPEYQGMPLRLMDETHLQRKLTFRHSNERIFSKPEMAQALLMGDGGGPQ
jgi:hypothetical protein